MDEKGEVRWMVDRPEHYSVLYPTHQEARERVEREFTITRVRVTPEPEPVRFYVSECGASWWVQDREQQHINSGIVASYENSVACAHPYPQAAAEAEAARLNIHAVLTEVRPSMAREE